MYRLGHRWLLRAEVPVKSLTLSIQGMSCGHCVQAVSQALSKLHAVTVESVRIGRAEVKYDESRIEPAAIAAVIAESGYPAVAHES
jgi:copper chaperone CopZ